ncbi:glycoside hydrolase family 2 protein [Parasphaerochaeta coccoides]|uniref:Glycoside hydrolase family 2 sugar binding protein n=1 Tax=Parasphaerochaeta coccoides (strain ATCC BAA-1237 / DSM 17374 / SPN1) TaxID=760011 RepID=F4GL61_PARC1|nr:sugar-binding domain-containing protein [Parasphaerochaeta coccoides]AEC02401.1 glycoside hydrolase family 2 sugar binding protein [Parasphaerochaeta coccoides DSM 17374]
MRQKKNTVWERKTATLLTPWGEELLGNLSMQPLPEYPRPQMVRDSYLNLNGWWHYAIIPKDKACERFDGEIRVPFSPESELSSVKRWVSPSDTLVYERSFELAEGFIRGLVLLHFGAVDQECEVFVNDMLAGTHSGGYLPFSFDISTFLSPQKNMVRVVVTDVTDSSFHSRGKQSSRPGGIWYTPQSGIWQTVWLESVPLAYVKEMKVTTDIDERTITLTVVPSFPANGNVRLMDGEAEIIRCPFDSMGTVVIPVPDMRLWSPEDPFLYGLRIEYGEDRVTSYAAMRKISIGTDSSGIRRLLLNNRPYFQNGVLDQGYWPDGLYTAPSDKALIYDITLMKKMGFNMLRKHIKIEPLRWYYHCDRLGMVVWQDMISGGGQYSKALMSITPFVKLPVDDTRCWRMTYRRDVEGRGEFERELEQTISLLANSPCVVVWVPFNEGWGQFDSKRIAMKIRRLDSSRLIDHASGWYDQGGGDFNSRHIYFRTVHFQWDERPAVLSEFGGYRLDVPGHTYNMKKSFGYKKFSTSETFNDAYRKLFGEQIMPLLGGGLSATIYTQLSDVEDETNGLVTYDRKVVKIDLAMVQKLNGILRISD